jgi:alpha-L-fucosidase 2
MKKSGQKILILFVVHAVVTAVELPDDSSLILRYEKPARHFTQSLPLGNGRLGMMVFAGLGKDRIVLNAESMLTLGRQPERRSQATAKHPPPASAGQE